MSERKSARETSDDGRTADGGYRWNCPYCGVSRNKTIGGADGEAYAIAALRAHILASDGEARGPRNEYPLNWAPALSEYVTEGDEVL